MRVGLVSDLHWTVQTPASAVAWHGGGEFAGVLDRLAAAVEHFDAERVDRIVIAGDLTHHGDHDSLRDVLSALSSSRSPVGIVSGNHDVGDDSEALDLALRHRAYPLLSLLDPTAVDEAGVALAGVHVGEAEGWFGARLRAHPSVQDLGTGPAVLVSHYPVLSLAVPISAAGLPYPGDLLDREELATALGKRRAPTLVLSGHIHARASLAEGPLLQLSTGALIEPPYECAVIDVESGPGDGLTVTRRCLSLLESRHRLQPIFAPEQESWRFESGVWQRLRAPLPGVIT